MLEESNQVFKVSKHFAIFYDDPKTQKGSECRVTYGIMVNEGELSKVSQFRQDHPRYNIGHLPNIKCQVSIFPYFNSLSYILIENRIYPIIRDKIKAEI